MTTSTSATTIFKCKNPSHITSNVPSTFKHAFLVFVCLSWQEKRFDIRRTIKVENSNNIVLQYTKPYKGFFNYVIWMNNIGICMKMLVLVQTFLFSICKSCSSYAK